MEYTVMFQCMCKTGADQTRVINISISSLDLLFGASKLLFSSYNTQAIIKPQPPSVLQNTTIYYFYPYLSSCYTTSTIFVTRNLASSNQYCTFKLTFFKYPHEMNHMRFVFLYLFFHSAYHTLDPCSLLQMMGSYTLVDKIIVQSHILHFLYLAFSILWTYHIFCGHTFTMDLSNVEYHNNNCVQAYVCWLSASFLNNAGRIIYMPVHCTSVQ